MRRRGKRLCSRVWALVDHIFAEGCACQELCVELETCLRPPYRARVLELGCLAYSLVWLHLSVLRLLSIRCYLLLVADVTLQA